MEKEKVVVDAEFTESSAEPQARCELTVGIDMIGNVYYRFGGPDQSLITLEGLLKYAEKEMQRLWSRTLDSAKAQG